MHPKSHSSPNPSLSSLLQHTLPINSKQNNKQTKTHLAPLSFPIPLHAFQWHWELWYVTQYTLMSSQPHLQNVHCNVSLIWFKASGTPLLNPHWNSSQISCWFLSHGGPGPVSSPISAGHRWIRC